MLKKNIWAPFFPTFPLDTKQIPTGTAQKSTAWVSFFIFHFHSLTYVHFCEVCSLTAALFTWLPYLSPHQRWITQTLCWAMDVSFVTGLSLSLQSHLSQWSQNLSAEGCKMNSFNPKQWLCIVCIVYFFHYCHYKWLWMCDFFSNGYLQTVEGDKVRLWNTDICRLEKLDKLSSFCLKLHS